MLKQPPALAEIATVSDRVVQLSTVNFNDPFHLAKFGLDMPGAATRIFVLADSRESRDSSTAPLTASTSGADNFFFLRSERWIGFRCAGESRDFPGAFAADPAAAGQAAGCDSALLGRQQHLGFTGRRRDLVYESQCNGILMPPAPPAASPGRTTSTLISMPAELPP